MTRVGFDQNHEVPIDRVAKRVVFGDEQNENYKPEVNSKWHFFSTSPLPMRDLSKLPWQVTRDPCFKDYTGFKYGQFTVRGLFALHRFNKWVVQCSCGNYEVRTTTKLNIPPTKVDQDRCQACQDLQRITHREYFKTHGKYPWDTGTRSTKEHGDKSK